MTFKNKRHDKVSHRPLGARQSSTQSAPGEEIVIVREEERLRGRPQRGNEEGQLAAEVAVRERLTRVQKHPQRDCQQEHVARRRDQSQTNDLVHKERQEQQVRTVAKRKPEGGKGGACSTYKDLNNAEWQRPFTVPTAGQRLGLEHEAGK